jgi:hypothetical protein
MLFEAHETERLAAVERKIEDTPVSSFGCLGTIILAIAVGVSQGSGAGWPIFFLCVVMVSLCTSIEQAISLHQLLLVR